MKPKAKIILISFFLAVLLAANFASAANATGGLVQCGGVGQNPCTIGDIILTIGRVINFLLSWAWLVSIGFITWGGLQMIFAGGNEEIISQGKTTLNHAIIGFIIILISFVLINFIIGLLTSGSALDANALINAFSLTSP